MQVQEFRNQKLDRKRIGVRWTVGDVSAEGFRALQLSVWGAYKMFGSAAEYVICLNSASLASAQRKIGALPPRIEWRVVTDIDLPAFMRQHLSPGMAEGVAWKFAPLRFFPDRHELSFDNDCIVWRLPVAIGTWLNLDDACLLAEDVRTCLGQFTQICGPEARNSGIRGLPPGYDLGGALEKVLRQFPVKLDSELDEQGLQVAALSSGERPAAVSVADVSVCSPFPPHVSHLGTCGAHFVGLNAKHLPWNVNGVGASTITREHWRSLESEISTLVGFVAKIAA